MAEVKFDKLGFAVIPLYIKEKDTSTMMSKDYKIDTGANCTTISKDWLFELGFDEEWIKTGKQLTGNDRPTVASGLPLDDCYEVILPEIHIGGWVGYNWQFDYDHGVCRFELIPNKRKLLFNQKEQSIHAIDEIKHKG